MDLKPAGVVRLPAELGIEGAGALYALLAPHLARPGPVTLEAPEVARLHAAALQVLAAFVRTRADAGAATEWHRVAAALREGAARLGLDGLLGLPTAPSH